MEILDNFAALCSAERNWTMERYTEQTIERIQQQAKGRNVFLFVSGGVDSSVAFLLLNRALARSGCWACTLTTALCAKARPR